MQIHIGVSFKSFADHKWKCGNSTNHLWKNGICALYSQKTKNRALFVFLYEVPNWGNFHTCSHLIILSNTLSKGHGIFPGVLSSTSLNTLLNRACGESQLLVLFNYVLSSNSYFVVGKIVVMAYLSNNEQFNAGKLTSVTCTASTDGTGTAWNGQEVRKYVSSYIFLFPCSAQERSSSHLGTEFVLNLEAAFDYFLLPVLMEETVWIREGLHSDQPNTAIRQVKHCVQAIQAWQGDSGEQLAAFSTSPPSCSLATHSVNKPFLAVSRFKKKNTKCLLVVSLTEKPKQVSGFTLPQRIQSTPSCIEGHRTEIILLGCGSALKLYSIFGALLEHFQDHHDTITSIWVVNMSLLLLQTFLHCLLCIL
ncbi:LOW QUALITY PROTEIN: uncharacterized protein ACIBXB_009008 [Morphnus guianensis]